MRPLLVDDDIKNLQTRVATLEVLVGVLAGSLNSCHVWMGDGFASLLSKDKRERIAELVKELP